MMVIVNLLIICDLSKQRQKPSNSISKLQSFKVRKLVEKRADLKLDYHTQVDGRWS
jgi:hypothetical protein